MLLRYGARNFYCFKEGLEISFELPPNCPKQISHGKSVSNLICVIGANGSGKTNALKALSFLKDLCANSFNNKPEDDIMICSFFHNEEPIDLYCEFKRNDVVYIYEVSLTEKKILSECLSRKKKRMSPIFTRKENELTQVIKEYSDLKKVKLRHNASIISTAHQYEIECILPIYSFFYQFWGNVRWIGRDDFPKDYRNVSKYYEKHPNLLEFSKIF